MADADSLSHPPSDAVADCARLEQAAKQLEQAGDTRGAITAWRRVLAAAPSGRAAHVRLAELLYEHGDQVAAIPHLRAIVDADRGKAKPVQRLARALELAGDVEGAIDAWRRAFDLRPDDVETSQRLVELLNDRGRAVESVPYLRVLIKAEPGRLKAAQRLARALEQAEESPEVVIPAWERVVALDPKNGEAHERLVDLLNASGRALETVPHLRVLAEASPTRTKLWQRLGRVLDQAGDAEGALEAWTRVADLDPADSEAHLRLSRLLSRFRRPIDAIPHLRFLAERSQGALKEWTLLAQAYKQVGAAEEELATWRRVLFIHPHSIEAHGRVAHLLHRTGRSLEAALHLRSLAELTPGDVGRWKLLASTLEQAGDAPGAISAWRTALAIRRTDSLSHERLSVLLRQLGRPSDAVPHLRAFAEIGGTRAKPWRELGRMLDELSRPAEAIAAWRRVLKTAPADVEAHERVARLLLRRGDRARAVRHLESLAETEPGQAERWNELARIRLDLGDVQGATAAWGRSLQAAEDLQVHTHVALALNQLNRKDAALPHFMTVAEGSPNDPHAWRRLARCARDVGSSEVAGRAWRQVLAIEGFDQEARDELEALHGAPEGESAVQGARSYLLSLLALQGAAKLQDNPVAFEVGDMVMDQILETVARLAESSSILDPESLQARRRLLVELFSDPRFAALSAARPAQLQQLFSGREDDQTPGLFLVHEALSAAPEPIAAGAGRAWRRGMAFEEASERAAAVSSSPWFGSPVLICGFHHSGTRVLAEALELCGVFQRTNTHSKEWSQIQWLNTLVLPGWADPEAIRTFEASAQRGHIDTGDLAFRLAAAGYDGHRPWGQKDPRNCVTAQVWQAAFPAARVVHITRDPLDTLGTLPHRYARFTPGGRRPQDELEHWEALWSLYLEGSRRAMAAAEHSVEIHFEDLCADPARVMTRVCQGLGLERRVTAEEMAPLGVNRGKVGQHRAWLETGALGADEVRRLRALGARAGLVQS